MIVRCEMGVEREDTQLQPTLVWTDIRFWPPCYRLVSPIPLSARSHHMCTPFLILQRKIGTFGPRCQRRRISVSEVIGATKSLFPSQVHYISETGEDIENRCGCIFLLNNIWWANSNRTGGHDWDIYELSFRVLFFLLTFTGCLFLQLDLWCQTVENFSQSLLFSLLIMNRHA